MNQLDYMIKKRKMELKIELAKLRELKRNQRKVKAIEQKVYHVRPMEIFVSLVGSFMDFIIDLVKRDESKE